MLTPQPTDWVKIGVGLVPQLKLVSCCAVALGEIGYSPLRLVDMTVPAVHILENVESCEHFKLTFHVSTTLERFEGETYDKLGIELKKTCPVLLNAMNFVGAAYSIHDNMCAGQKLTCSIVFVW